MAQNGVESPMSEQIRNVFISHHHKDDASVDGLVDLVRAKGYRFRNSSVRVKPENEERVRKGQVSDRAIERLLRMKMRWAGQLIVIVGKETHSRPWVNWEIKVASQLGMPIVGVYENGLKDKIALPSNLEKHATALVGWRAGSVIDALSGGSKFENPDGSPRERNAGGHVIC